MKTVDFIRKGLEASAAMTFALIDDLKDAPMQVPTGNGGNTPMWILGHLVCAEGGIVQHVMQGKGSPVARMERDVFGGQGTHDQCRRLSRLGSGPTEI